MNASALTNALQQLSLLAEQAEGTSLQRIAPATGFAGELQSSLQRINQLQQTATRQSNAFQAGSEAVSLSDVMADSQKASVAFQMGVQVRNRLLSAYKDVMAMQV
ncbi:flagellar hook-basal body complex protein FliE [Pseudomonas extremaustralis]|jgi:flagellar hook-basal body complex protein FliE|uniref:Flagellar hook-basal body complex protein FliE n=1 Tax=Pseudomonas extremaustralis TaxID=359110 RepID=A0A5C5Q5X9_9PSED|nr:flagellar hook-basal body complex protein FliE [Pseudomonas extremaustralis]EZI24802.1 flagellar basal body protein FliE [Pseudomonas extremaustralis 14-3 substr. 14-3b]MDB1109531.1 flagellar hook-basal body complex protein FliE [Pseudomonas extremaustralis]MDF3134069.1 flagellar hook-basal body complex protein FliE [Pseudomonas extremaustralis]MDG2969931.1 flagellar hook-basal body complex protein FliE [Pseudomonas extremaustralis]MDY7068554.1 Flagellar hook-basal body complex protein FliE